MKIIGEIIARVKKDLWIKIVISILLLFQTLNTSNGIYFIEFLLMVGVWFEVKWFKEALLGIFSIVTFIMFPLILIGVFFTSDYSNFLLVLIPRLPDMLIWFILYRMVRHKIPFGFIKY